MYEVMSLTIDDYNDYMRTHVYCQSQRCLPNNGNNSSRSSKDTSQLLLQLIHQKKAMLQTAVFTLSVTLSVLLLSQMLESKVGVLFSVARHKCKPSCPQPEVFWGESGSRVGRMRETSAI